MAKKKQSQLVTVVIKGLDITIPDVRLISVPGNRKTGAFVHLEEKAGRWHILHSGAELFDNFKDRMVVEFNRDEGFLLLKLVDSEQATYRFGIDKATRINSACVPKLLHVDELPDKLDYRLTWSNSFFDECRDITSIEITQQS